MNEAELEHKELRTIDCARQCAKCGLVMSGGSMVAVFRRDAADAPWKLVAFEHPTACPGELMKKRPSLSARPYVGSSWSG